MVPAINFWTVLIATASSMVVGAIWYTPRVFGTYWMRAAKITPSGDAKDAIRPILVTVLVSFITAWVLSGAVFLSWSFYEGTYLSNALGTGFVLWAGFTAARFITHDAFDGRPTGLTVLNVAHELVTIMLMALIIGVWPPAGTV